MPRRSPAARPRATAADDTEQGVFLTGVSLRTPIGEDEHEFPFSVPIIRALGDVRFRTRVTFFVGDNGSGKSTLLEGIAAAAGAPTVGSDEVGQDATLGTQRALARRLRLGWRVRTHRGFFLRAEDFFGFAKRLSALRSEMHARLAQVEEEYRDRSAWAKGLAAGPANASLEAMERRYGVDLDANSHGQSFLRLFQSRVVPEGLYLLDEPEAPLSPQSQLALLALLHDMIAQRSQFIIATHSPILLAFPGATIYTFDDGAIRVTRYEELEHVKLTREFLMEPGRFLKYLMEENE